MKYFGGLFGIFLMTWGYIHPTYLLFSIANSCGKRLMLLQCGNGDSTSAVFPWVGVAPGSPPVLLLKVKELLFFKISKRISRNPSKMTKKGSGFKHGIIQNTNWFCALCELHKKKNLTIPLIFANTDPKQMGNLQFNTSWFRES